MNNELIKSNELIIDKSFNGHIAVYKNGKDKAIYYLPEKLTSFIFNQLIDSINNEYQIHYTLIFNHIQLFKVNIQALDNPYFNDIEQKALDAYTKQFILKEHYKGKLIDYHI